MRAGTLAIAYGFIDYCEAYYKNQKGKAFEIFGTKFQPDMEWDQPEDFKGDYYEGAKYFVRHIATVAGTQFLKEPIATFTDGVAIKLAKKFLGDPENQKKKKEIEQELYQEQWEAFWKNRKNLPDYQNGSPAQKVEVEANIKDSFQTAFMSASGTRKALDSLDK